MDAINVCARVQELLDGGLTHEELASTLPFYLHVSGWYVGSVCVMRHFCLTAVRCAARLVVGCPLPLPLPSTLACLYCCQISREVEGFFTARSAGGA